MEGSLEINLAPALLVAVRIATLLAVVPFLGSRVIPVRIKMGLGLALTLLLAPGYASQSATLESLESINWGRFLLSEVTAGLLLGFALHLVFEAVRIAGQLMGVQAGFSLVNLFDPQSNASTPVLGLFLKTTAMLLFLQMDVHLWIVRGLAKSFEYVPPGTALFGGAAAEKLMQVAGGMWLAALQMAAPVLLATVLADIAMGFMAKASPQLPVLLVGVSVKAAIVFVVLGGAVAFWPGMLETQFSRAIGFSEQLLGLAR